MKWALPLVAAVTVVVSGCGGGGGEPLTKEQLITRGDAICTKYRRKNQELSKKAPAKSPTDPSATDEQVKASAPILETLADNLRAARKEFAELKPPADVEHDWENTLEDLDQLASRLDTAAGSARSLDRQRVVNEYTEIFRLNHRISVFEQDYGFKVCGTSA